jgi:hypothetical protein
VLAQRLLTKLQRQGLDDRCGSKLDFCYLAPVPLALGSSPSNEIDSCSSARKAEAQDKEACQ